MKGRRYDGTERYDADEFEWISMALIRRDRRRKLDATKVESLRQAIETGREIRLLAAFKADLPADRPPDIRDKANVLGYAFDVSGVGFWARIDGYLAVTPDLGRVIGVVFLQHSETPGLGGRLTEARWRGKFRGLDVTAPAAGGPFLTIGGEVPAGPESPRYGRHVEAITGATGTSTAVATFLNQRIAEFRRAAKAAGLATPARAEPATPDVLVRCASVCLRPEGADGFSRGRKPPESALVDGAPEGRKKLCGIQPACGDALSFALSGLSFIEGRNRGLAPPAKSEGPFGAKSARLFRAKPLDPDGPRAGPLSPEGSDEDTTRSPHAQSSCAEMTSWTDCSK